MPANSTPPRPIFWRSLFAAAFLGGLIGALITANEIKEQGTGFLGGLAYFAGLLLFGPLAAGLIWLPLMAFWRLSHPPKERAGWLILIPAAFVFAVAFIPVGQRLTQRWNARQLEQQVLTALNAPKDAPAPWGKIDTHVPAVRGAQADGVTPIVVRCYRPVFASLRDLLFKNKNGRPSGF